MEECRDFSSLSHEGKVIFIFRVGTEYRALLQEDQQPGGPCKFPTTLKNGSADSENTRIAFRKLWKRAKEMILGSQIPDFDAIILLTLSTSS